MKLANGERHDGKFQFLEEVHCISGVERSEFQLVVSFKRKKWPLWASRL